MIDAEPILLVAEDGPAVTLTLNRPAQGNSLSMPLVSALREALASLAPRKDVKAIVIRATGERIFSAGHDLREFGDAPDAEFLEADFAGIAGLMQAIMAQPQIVIARVEGVATAAGLELVAACDLALAATTARFALPGVNIGFWCHTPQVPVSRAVGAKHAMEMLVTGRLYPPEHALRIGLVNSLHSPDELDAALADLVATIALKASSVLRAGKASFRAQAGLPVRQAYDHARAAALANITHPDAREGIAAFLEKRDPRWEH
jgi:enoyl-CoA hydratase/carnithine racemase